jgi:hypothetical protein
MGKVGQASSLPQSWQAGSLPHFTIAGSYLSGLQQQSLLRHQQG